MKGSVYIIKSLETKEYYIGSSKKPYFRLKQHNNGYVVATRYKRPYKLMFVQKFRDIKLAYRIEKKIKSWKRKDFIDKIIEDGVINFAKNKGL